MPTMRTSIFLSAPIILAPYAPCTARSKDAVDRAEHEAAHLHAAQVLLGLDFSHRLPVGHTAGSARQDEKSIRNRAQDTSNRERGALNDVTEARCRRYAIAQPQPGTTEPGKTTRPVNRTLHHEIATISHDKGTLDRTRRFTNAMRAVRWSNSHWFEQTEISTAASSGAFQVLLIC